MFLTKFDEEAYRRATRNEGYEDGYSAKHDNGQKEYYYLLKALVESNRMDNLKQAIADKIFRQQLLQEFGIGKQS